jgi:hypothetical protein
VTFCTTATTGPPPKTTPNTHPCWSLDAYVVTVCASKRRRLLHHVFENAPPDVNRKASESLGHRNMPSRSFVSYKISYIAKECTR